MFDSSSFLSKEPNQNVFIGESRFGKGLFAQKAFLKDEFIILFEGTVLSLQKVMKTDIPFNTLQIAKGLYIDLQAPGVYANHSCQPNAGLKNLALTAIKPIGQGEEIYYDYSTTIDDKEEMNCACGGPSCRLIIGDFKDLPKKTRVCYLNLGIVLPFIAHQFHSNGNKKHWNSKNSISPL